MPTKAELTTKLAERDDYISDLQRRLRIAEGALEGEKERWTQLVNEHNALLHTLDEIFVLKIYSKGDQEGDELLWIVEDSETGTVLVERCVGLAVAYREAITRRLEEKR